MKATSGSHGGTSWRRSLQWRLLLVTWIGMAVAFFLAGMALQTLFSEHVQRQFRADLAIHLEQLTAKLEFDAQGQPVVDATQLSDPRWLKPLSGRYWQVDAYPRTTSNAATAAGLLRSRSLWDGVLHLPPDVIADGSTHLHALSDPDGHPLMALERTVRAPAPHTQSWTLVVAADASDTQAAIAQFASVSTATLGVLLVLLGVASATQVGVGLSPLRTLQKAIAALEQGHTAQVQGQFPAEIQPLVDGFNRTLQRQEEHLLRARTQAGNLAHALKTPLAVIRYTADHIQHHALPSQSSELEQLGLQLHEQVNKAQQHIDWHLRRARFAAHAAAMQRPRCALLPTLHGLQRVMAKVHAQRSLHITCHSDAADPHVCIEQEDLHDMLGNLIDNACKWATSHVHLHVHSNGDVTIEDDGPGVPETQQRLLCQRGQRLDEHTPGSGLGLAIVAELADLYEAQLTFAPSAMGGLRVGLSWRH